MSLGWIILAALALGLAPPVMAGNEDTPTPAELALRLTLDDHGRWSTHAEAMAAYGDEAVAPLVLVLQDPESTAWTRRKIAWTLGMTGSDLAVAPLVESLGDSDGAVRHAAVQSLGDLGEPAVESLASALRGGDPLMRFEAVRALARIDSQQSTGLLASGLDDTEWPVRKEAALALGRRGQRQAIPVLVEVADRGQARATAQAVRALGEMGAAQAVPSLVKALGHDDWAVRGDAVKALVAIGQPAVGPLLEVADQGSLRARRRAVEALGRLQALDATEALLAALTSDDWMLRDEAAVALARLGSTAEARPLVAALAHPEPEVRKAAAWVLGEIAATDATDALITKLADPECNAVAATALGRIGAESAVVPIHRLLVQGSLDARRAAAWALVRIASPPARLALSDAHHDPDHEVRYWVAEGCMPR